jgi:hypothetical protein
VKRRAHRRKIVGVAVRKPTKAKATKAKPPVLTVPDDVSRLLALPPAERVAELRRLRNAALTRAVPPVTARKRIVNTLRAQLAEVASVVRQADEELEGELADGRLDEIFATVARLRGAFVGRLDEGRPARLAFLEALDAAARLDLPPPNPDLPQPQELSTTERDYDRPRLAWATWSVTFPLFASRLTAEDVRLAYDSFVSPKTSKASPRWEPDAPIQRALGKAGVKSVDNLGDDWRAHRRELAKTQSDPR